MLYNMYVYIYVTYMQSMSHDFPMISRPGVENKTMATASFNTDSPRRLRWKIRIYKVAQLKLVYKVQ